MEGPSIHKIFGGILHASFRGACTSCESTWNEAWSILTGPDLFDYGCFAPLKEMQLVAPGFTRKDILSP